MRTPRQVLDDHLRRAKEGDLDGDVRANYAEDVVLIDREKVRHGHDGVLDAAGQLAGELPDASFEYVMTAVEGEIAISSGPRRPVAPGSSTARTPSSSATA
jgi:hypothetical protein